jgi:hypothetical protein
MSKVAYVGQGFSPEKMWLRCKSSSIASAIKYLNFVIPAEAGIQIYFWMPEQVRHDEVGHLVASLNLMALVPNLFL